LPLMAFYHFLDFGFYRKNDYMIAIFMLKIDFDKIKKINDCTN
jgi:hypothetical protein